MELVALAIAPGIAICLYLFYTDVYNREPKKNLIISFILGCLAIVPAIFFELAFSYTQNGTILGTAIFAYAVVGFSEEFSKYLGLRFYSYNQKAFDEPLDGIVYAVMISMGFATVENIMYAVKYQSLNVVVMRMFLSVPAHATFAVVMGYFIGKAKFDSKKSFGLMLTGLLGAIFFHGSFDFFIFLAENQLVSHVVSDGLLVTGAIGSFITALVLSRKLILRSKLISKQMFTKDPHSPVV